VSTSESYFCLRFFSPEIQYIDFQFTSVREQISKLNSAVPINTITPADFYNRSNFLYSKTTIHQVPSHLSITYSPYFLHLFPACLPHPPHYPHSDQQRFSRWLCHAVTCFFERQPQMSHFRSMPPDQRDITDSSCLATFGGNIRYPIDDGEPLRNRTALRTWRHTLKNARSIFFFS
jgi:hypothetical protein